MSEMEETMDGRNRKIQLLAAIRDKKQKDAVKLLQEGAGVDYRDQTGSYPLHYAATEGFDDIIETLLEKGANVMAWNNSGRTALHLAAMHGRVRSTVILVAWGAVVRTLDQKGCLAFEYAVKNKHVAVVELLSLFGSEPLLQDWTWLEQKDIKKKKAEFAIAKIIQNQIRLTPGYRHSGIIFDVERISPDEGPVVSLEKTGVEVSVIEGQERYYLYLCQTEETYGSPPPLDKDEDAFGHLLECQTWPANLKTITLKVNVDRVLRPTEEIVLRPATMNGSIDNVEVQELDGAGITIVTMTVPLESTGITYFAMASREKKQVFQVSDEAVTLKPEGDPEAEIDIPAGTFDSCELLVKFVDTVEEPEEPEEEKTKTTKKDTEKPKEDQVLMTSILDLSTADGQQPSNEIEMKMPVTTKDQTEGVVILATSNPDPNLEEWTWDELPAEIDADGKAVFKINHFSIFSGTSKPSFTADPDGVKGAVRKKYLRMRKVEFLVAVKTPEVNETHTDVIVICGTKRKNKTVKTKYDDSYTWFSLGSETEVPEGQIFQIGLRGNLKERTDDDMKLMFKGSNQESSRALEIIGTDHDSLELAGEIDIIKETKTPAPDRVEMVTVGCIFNQRTLKTVTKSNAWEINTQNLCTIPFSATLTKREPEPEPEPEAEPKHDEPIPAFSRPEGPRTPLEQNITWRKLHEAAKTLSYNEAQQMGYQLGLGKELMKTVLRDTMDENDLATNVLKKWRLLKAKNDMVSHLKQALEAIGRRDMIQKIKMGQNVSK